MLLSPRFLAAALTVALPSIAFAAPIPTNLITNGGFETTTLKSSQQFTTQIAGWSNAATSGYTGYGYSFLIMPGTGDTSGFNSLGGNHDYFWGPNGSSNYSNNGLTASSPTGGNFIAADGDSNFRGAISQSISGLTVGSTYQLSFDWGATQFYGYSGDTTDAWQVTLGNDTMKTAVINTPSHGFSAWRTATMTFTASSATELLSFLAIGTPSGEPPTLLLDNVSLTATNTNVPEPASMVLLGAGLVGFAAFRRRRAA